MDEYGNREIVSLFHSTLEEFVEMQKIDVPCRTFDSTTGITVYVPIGINRGYELSLIPVERLNRLEIEKHGVAIIRQYLRRIFYLDSEEESKTIDHPLWKVHGSFAIMDEEVVEND